MKLLDEIESRNFEALRRATVLEKKVFRYAYDKTLTFGVKFSSADLELEVGEPSDDMFYLLDKLITRDLTGAAARDAVQAFASENGCLIKLICNKHLQVGASAKTINKYIPGCIPTFQVQLAKEIPLEQVKFPCYGQLKYDGVRVVILKTHGNQLYFLTRNGLELHLPKMAKKLEDLPANTMIDTEATIHNGISADRTRVSGMLNSARQGNKIAEDILVFNAFDYMTATEFLLQDCRVHYKLRLERLESLLNGLGPNINNTLIKAETRVLGSINETNIWFDEVLGQDKEGLVLKPHDHYYSFKRSKDWVKLKAVKSADLKCVGWQEGENKYRGMIGALICEGEVEGKQVVVSVGSGLTDRQRGYLPDMYVGKTIEVKYNSVIDDVYSNYSLFLPRFVEVRFDK